MIAVGGGRDNNDALGHFLEVGGVDRVQLVILFCVGKVDERRLERRAGDLFHHLVQPLVLGSQGLVFLREGVSGTVQRIVDDGHDLLVDLDGQGLDNRASDRKPSGFACLGGDNRPTDGRIQTFPSSIFVPLEAR